MAEPGGIHIDSRTVALQRDDRQVHVMDVPPLGSEELRGYIQEQLRERFPGKPERTVFDYRTFEAGGIRRALVVATTSEVVERYRSELSGQRITDPAVLLGPEIRKGAEQAFCLRLNGLVEWWEWSNGLPVRAETLTKEDDAGARVGHYLRAVSDGSREVVLVTESGEAADDIDVSETGDDRRVRRRSLDQLWRRSRRSRSVLFSGRGRRTRIGSAARVAAFAALLPVLGVISLHQEAAVTEERAARLSSQLQLFEERAVTANRLNQEIDELRSRLDELRSGVTADPYEVLSTLYRVSAGSDTDILSLRVRGREIDVSFESGDAIGLLQSLQSSGIFSSVSPSQVRPVSGSERERFSVTGELSDG